MAAENIVDNHSKPQPDRFHIDPSVVVLVVLALAVIYLVLK